MARILVVDDEQSMREFLAILLRREGYDTDEAESAEKALELLTVNPYELVLSDVNMPGLGGMDLLRETARIAPDTAVIMVTAFSSAEQAVEAMKSGAYDYIPKPFKVEEIKVLVRNALERRELKQENLRLRQVVRGQFSIKGLVGKSPLMQQVFSLIEKYGNSFATVLISGESGTGKELVAKAIHLASARSGKPFVGINCGAIPESLIEAELFGHRKGSFTGAIADRTGFFEQAEGGTLFLDEIGEIPLSLQPKLLRVIQEREFRRVGDVKDRKTDVRLIAATNREMGALVREGKFREDLYYRLNVLHLTLPPLRERREDIPLLVSHFMEKFSGEGRGGKVTPGALELLIRYPFPGNVRELENMIERALVLGDGIISEAVIPPLIIPKIPESNARDSTPKLPVGVDLESFLNDIERGALINALERSGGVKKRAAELLGITFRSFRYRLAKFGMDEE
jgi:two-component system response regulator PilR (NtrC family)